MARQQLPIIAPKGPYPGTVTATQLDFVFTTADSVNFDQFALTGRELIIIQNSTGGALTVTFTSVPDERNRSADITAYSVGIGLYSCFWVGNIAGWNNAGQFFMTASASTLKYAIIRIPG